MVIDGLNNDKLFYLKFIQINNFKASQVCIQMRCKEQIGKYFIVRIMTPITVVIQFWNADKLIKCILICSYL